MRRDNRHTLFTLSYHINILYDVNSKLERQHTLAAVISPVMSSLKPTQPMIWGRPHHRENFPTLSNSRLVWILLRLLRFDQWRKHKGDKADGLKSPPNDANIWKETRFSVATAMHDPKQFFLKTLVFGQRNPQPTARQMSARPTELTRRHLIQCSCIQY